MGGCQKFMPACRCFHNMAASCTHVVVGCCVLLTLLVTHCTAKTSCTDLDSCDKCKKYENESCIWCHDGSHKGCYSLEDLVKDNEKYGQCNSWCAGDNCDCDLCADSLYPCSHKAIGQILLMLLYGVVLAYGAKLISDGSELLLEILDPGIIGGLVLPIMGAIPDAAIIVVSGMFGSKEEAQRQIAVGVGTLAGSTIMLLTIPWFASMILARCDFRNGRAVDGKCNGFSLTQQGVTVDDDTPVNARIMLFVSLSYLIVQFIAFFYLNDPTGQQARKHEKWVAFATMFICFGFLAAYCTYQILNPRLQEKKMKEARRQYLMKQSVNAFLRKLNTIRPAGTVEEPSEESPILPVRDVSHADVGLASRHWLTQAKKAAEEKGTVIQEEDDEDEENDQPKDAKAIAVKSALILLFGTGLVAFFSDPMVEVIDDFGDTIHIGIFYISFVVTPFCSNASEFISSLIFAAKKRKRNASLTYSQLYGAATMNSTLGLGMFCLIIFVRGLAWNFTAETLSILLITWVVGLVGSFKTTFALWWAFPVLLLYPLSLLFVFVLENYVKWT